MPHILVNKATVLLSWIMIGLLAAVMPPAGGAVRADNFSRRLAQAAFERTRHRVVYDGAYYRIPCPGGDVPAHVGVCTDLVIRSYRALGVDLQQAVHEDMTRHFADYPSKRIWGLRRPDPNIDHRRVPNLQVFFTRQGEVMAISAHPKGYLAGDLVTWMLPGNLPHIGIVADQRTTDGRPLIVHNIGAGPRLEDVLFRFPITGHYRYPPEEPDFHVEPPPARTIPSTPLGYPPSGMEDSPPAPCSDEGGTAPVRQVPVGELRE